MDRCGLISIFIINKRQTLRERKSVYYANHVQGKPTQYTVKIYAQFAVTHSTLKFSS